RDLLILEHLDDRLAAARAVSRRRAELACEIDVGLALLGVGAARDECITARALWRPHVLAVLGHLELRLLPARWRVAGLCRLGLRVGGTTGEQRERQPEGPPPPAHTWRIRAIRADRPPRRQGAKKNISSRSHVCSEKVSPILAPWRLGGYPIFRS